MKRIATIALLLTTVLLSGCVKTPEEPIDQPDDKTPYEVIQEAMENTTISTTVEDIVLPLNSGDVTISWTSNIDGTITPTGTLIQGVQDQEVTLTAIFSYEDKVLTKLYTTTILGTYDINQDLIDVNDVLSNLIFESYELTEDENFDVLINGVSITWSSDDTTCLSNEGEVTRPSEDDGDCTATVTVTLSKGDESTETTFTFTVLSLSTTVSYTGYYEGIDGLTGSALEDALYTIIHDGFSGVTYGTARTALSMTDMDPNNPSNLILVYEQRSVSGTWDSGNTWNREHVWPQSMLDSSANNNTVNSASDLHNLKPADPGENSARGSLPFGTTGSTYEPPDVVKGDIARICFYMSVMYDMNLSAVGTPSQLLQWNIDDPVDDFEMNRNEVILYYQGNRNPFIDHPELASLIWS